MAWEKFENIRGPKGERGPVGVVSSASAAAVAPDRPAKVVLSGTEDVHMHLEVPRGERGERGPAGVASSASAESVPADRPAKVVLEQHGELVHMALEVPRGLPGVDALPAAEAVGTFLSAGDSPSEPGFAVGVGRQLATRGSAGWDATTERLRLLSFNVLDYGADPTGVEDCSTSVQSAADAVRDSGGGVILFPPGRYRLDGMVTLPSNCSVTGPGATILKTAHSEPGWTYIAFAALGGSGSMSNVSIHDISFQGALPYYGVMVLWAHRCNGVRAWNVRVNHALTNGHCFDLQGCSDVVIEDCEFAGMEPKAGREFAEAIQLDSSTRAGSPLKSTPGQIYDGTPSSHVTVRRCRFVGVDSYKAPRALGSHDTVEGQYYSHVVFEENYIEDPPASSVYQAVVNFIAVTNCTVRNNRFNISNPSVYPFAVSFHPALRWMPAALVDSADAAPVTATDELRGVRNCLSGNSIPESLIGASLDWVPVEYATGFREYSAGARPQVFWSDGNVELSGVFARVDAEQDSSDISTATFVKIGDLPYGYWPKRTIRRACAASGDDTFMVQIEPNGAISISRYSNPSRTNPYLAISQVWSAR